MPKTHHPESTAHTYSKKAIHTSKSRTKAVNQIWFPRTPPIFTTSYNPKIRRAVKEYTTRATAMDLKPKSNCKEQANTTHLKIKQCSTLLNSKTQVTTPVQSSRHPRFKPQLPTSHQGSLRPLPTRTTTSSSSNNRLRHPMPRRMLQVASHLLSLRQL